MDSPPSSPFATANEANNFESFSLSPENQPGGGGGGSMQMPSLQSIQNQQMMMQQQEQAQRQQQPSFNNLPAPNELQGPMATNANNDSWHSSSSGNYNTSSSQQNAQQQQPQSLLSKLLTCGGLCSISSLQPYFDIDTSDIIMRIKCSLKYVLVNDGFVRDVLYSDVAERLDSVAVVVPSDGEGSGNGEEQVTTTTAVVATIPTPSSPTTSLSTGKGPDLYGPIWLTATFVFFVAITSNISIYIHHTSSSFSNAATAGLEEGGAIAEQTWDYDINQLLRATSILYSFSLGLPTVLYLVFRVVGVQSIGLVDLICIYGYSLVAYLPMVWICIVPVAIVQWVSLGMATLLSGMLVLRNVVGPIMEVGSGVGGGMGSGGKSGGLIMSVIGCHFVFFLVMKLAFYHHHA